MSRTRLFRNPAHRQSIGDAHVNEATAAMAKTQIASVSLLTRYSTSREETLRMLFRDDDLAKLEQVRGMVKTSGDVRTYDIGPYATLSIDFAGALVPAIEPSRLYLSSQLIRAPSLLTYVAEVRAVHDRFEEVKAVLRWLNHYATPGAIRYYWPMAMKLCPKSTIWRDLQDVPSRYIEPPHVGDWTQSLKDAAATVTGSLMMPSDTKPRDRKNMWLTFAPRVVSLSDDSKYSTDQMSYNI